MDSGLQTNLAIQAVSKGAEDIQIDPHVWAFTLNGECALLSNASEEMVWVLIE